MSSRVLVIGAGPAGAALALGLARAGIPTTLVEASSGFARELRGEGLMPSGLEALRRLGMDPLPSPVPRRVLRGWAFYLEGRMLFQAAEPLGSDVPCTLVEQPALLQALVGAACREQGFRFRGGVPVVEALAREGRWTAVRLADGTVLEGDLLVGCDGRGSLLRRQAGLPLRRVIPHLDVLWFRVDAPAAAALERWLEDRFVTLVGPSGSLALFPSCRGGVRIGWALDPAAAVPVPAEGWPALWAANAPVELAALLRPLPAGAVAGPRRLPVQVGWAPRWHRSGLLLLGDAAHPMSPVRAQGINMALRDAVVAIDRLLPALHSGGHGEIDAAASRIAPARLREICAIQGLQQREEARAALLRRQPWLRRALARAGPWGGALLRARWVGDQHRLRDGLPGALPP